MTTSNNKVTLTYKEAGTIALIALNILVIAPGSIILRTLWDTSQAFIIETNKNIKDLEEEIDQTRINSAQIYVTNEELKSFQETINARLLSINESLISRAGNDEN